MNSHGVRFIIVGGHAVAFHAKPRFTKDIDLFVEPDEKNANKLLQALEEFGFGNLDLTTGDFTSVGRVVQLGMAPNRIDLVTSIDGVSFEEAWEGRASGQFGKQSVFFLGRQELIRNKKASGRPQDLADLDWLE